MNKFFLIKVLSLICIGFVSCSGNDQPVDHQSSDKRKVYVLLLGGQSNAVGWGYHQYLLDEKHPLSEPQLDILLFHELDGNGYLPDYTLLPLQSGSALSEVKPLPNLYPELTVAPINRFGPELSLGRTVRDRIRDKDSKFVIIKWARGGTNLYEQWKADGTENTASDGIFYKNFQNTVHKGMQAIKVKYPDYETKIIGMAWVQGESDAIGNQGTKYEENLNRFINDVRVTFGNIPFVLNKIAPQQIEDTYEQYSQQWELVRKAQDKVASSMENVYVTETIGEKYPVAKGYTELQYHYLSSGLLQIGKDLGNALPIDF